MTLERPLRRRATRFRSVTPAGLAAALALLACGCITETRNVQQPTLRIQTPGGTELGVSTDYGVLFLGRTARAGEVEITAWFGDGPSIEPSVIEPLGGGLYTAQTEIQLPRARLTFALPDDGSDVTIIGRRGNDVWEASARVRADDRVDGLLLSLPGELRDRDSQIGAGVFVGDGSKRQLVGLVSGRLLLDGEGGRREYLTVVGPADTWRLVVHDRSIQHKKPFLYRDDVL